MEWEPDSFFCNSRGPTLPYASANKRNENARYSIGRTNQRMVAQHISAEITHPSARIRNVIAYLIDKGLTWKP